MGHTPLGVCPILVSISAGARSPDQLLRGFHGGDDRRFLFIFKGSGISDHHIITLAEAFDRKAFAKIHDLIFPIVRDEHQVVRIQSIDRACDGFFLLASIRGTARRRTVLRARASKTQWDFYVSYQYSFSLVVRHRFVTEGDIIFRALLDQTFAGEGITNLLCFCIFHMDLDQASTCSDGGQMCSSSSHSKE